MIHSLVSSSKMLWHSWLYDPFNSTVLHCHNEIIFHEMNYDIHFMLIYLIKLWLCPFDLGYRGCFQESVSHQDHFVWGWWPGTTIWTCSSALPGNIQHPHIADPCTTTPAYRFWGILKFLNEWISLVDISYKDFWFKLFN